jgi:hypothetical protein
MGPPGPLDKRERLERRERVEAGGYASFEVRGLRLEASEPEDRRQRAEDSRA